MLKNFFLGTVVVAAVVAGTGCGSDCARTDCGNAVLPIFSFRLLNSSGKELLSGPAKQYDTTNLAVKAKRVDNGAIENVRRNVTVVADTNYLTSFGVSTSYAVYYISINNAITDSLVFNFNNRQADCCDLSYFSLNKVNTSAVSPPLSLPYHSYPIVK